MADRYQDRPFQGRPDSSHDHDDDRAGQASASKSEGDPLAELARLIGQTDPFSNFGRSNPTHPLRPGVAAPRTPSVTEEQHMQDIDERPAGPPPWMQNRVAREPAPVPQPSLDLGDSDISARPHPLHRYPQQQPAVEPIHDLPDHAAPSFAAEADPHQPADDRYDEALYGQYDDPAHDPQHQQYTQPGYQDDGYGHQQGYDDSYDEPERKSRRGGMMTVAAVVALAVVGTGAAFGYRTYIGSPRSGEPPVIKADVTPTKVVPPSAGDANAKLIQDRIATGNGAEKLVSREEAPVDVRNPGNAGPRVVFPPLNQNGNPPSTASVATVGKPMTVPTPAAGDEPRKVKTLAVKGDQADVAATPAAKPAARAPAAAAARPPANANASANAPMSLSPQAQPVEPRTRVAATNPTQAAPSSGGYVVQVASQRSEADAQASFRALQGKYPSVLGSRTALIKRADLGEKGVYYRAMVGTFGSPEEASQMCGSLKSAGGQCVVQRN